MLPGFLVPSYKQYKLDSDAVATWLANTAQQHGYAKKVAEETVPQGKRPRLKGKARKQAKADKPVQKPTQDGPKYLISVDEFISLAEWIAATMKSPASVPTCITSSLNRAISVRKQHQKWWETEANKNRADTKEEEEANETHRYFIAILEKVRDILRPLMNPDFKKEAGHPKGVKHVSKQPDSNDLENLFELLDIEEPSDVWLRASPGESRDREAVNTGTVQYSVRQELDYQEARFAAHCLFHDLEGIRSYLQRLWGKYGQGACDLEAVSVTTNTAIGFVKRLEDDYRSVFQEWADWTRHMATYHDGMCRPAGDGAGSNGYPDDAVKAATHERSEKSLVRTHFTPTAFLAGEKKAAPEHVEGCPEDYCNRPERLSSPPTENVFDEQSILWKLFPDVLLPEGGACNDEGVNGLHRSMWEAYKSQGLSLTFTFAAQIYLDMFDTLGEEVDKCFSELQTTAAEARKSLKEALSFHGDTLPIYWKRNYNEFLHSTLSFIDACINTNYLEECRETVAEKLGIKMLPIVEHELPKHHPLWCGLASLNIKSATQQVILLYVNGWVAILGCAHLYNALQQEKLISKRWEDMELVLSLHDQSAIFVGEPPSTLRDYYIRFYLAMGVSANTFAKNKRKPVTGRKLEARRIGAKSGLRTLNDISMVSDKFSRIFHSRDGRSNFGPEDVYKVLATEYGQPQLFPHDPSGGESADDERRHEPDSTALSPIQLLQYLQQTIQFEQMQMGLDHFQLHKTCWELLRAIECKLCDDLREHCGIHSPLRPEHLVFMVGAILESCIPAGSTLVRHGAAKAKSRVTRCLIEGSAEVVQEMLDSGKGSVQVKKLKGKYGEDFRQNTRPSGFQS